MNQRNPVTGERRCPEDAAGPVRVRAFRILLLLLLTLALSGSVVYAEVNVPVVSGSLCEKYRDYVVWNAEMIDKVISEGGSSLVKGFKVTKKDVSQLKKVVKNLRKAKNRGKYYKFNRRFSTELQLTGYLDTVVAQKYRYLDLRDRARSTKSPYYPYLRATTRNKNALDYYIRHEKQMRSKLDRIYKKQIAPFKSAKGAVKIAVAVNVVANYLEYDDAVSDSTGNLPYSVNRKKGVCSDYSYMMDYFLRRLGYKTRLVTVGLNPDSHMINALKSGGAWFYIDPTNMDMGETAFVGYSRNLYFGAKIDSLYMARGGWKLRSVF